MIYLTLTPVTSKILVVKFKQRTNKLRTSKLLIVILFFVLAASRQATALLVEKGINPLRLEVGGRPLGMGGAFTGLADDVNAQIYNPGGMAWAKGISLTIKDIDNFTGVQAYPLGNGASVGLGVINSKISGLRTGGVTTTSSSNIVLFSYGTKLNFLPAFYNKYEALQRVGVGFNLKNLYQQTLLVTGQRDRSANALNMDLGVLWKATPWWSAGLSLQNILSGNNLKWDTAGDEKIPDCQKIGFSANVIGDLDSPVFLEGRELTVAGELNFSSFYPTMLRLGGEWVVNKRYFFRTGIMQQWNGASLVANLNFGLGYRALDWGVDLVSCREPVKDEARIYFSFLYLPQDWIVIKKLDTPKPSVILEAPFEKISIEDNVVTYDDKIEVAGKVKEGVDVFVNGLRAATGDNNFKVVVPLQMEKNLVVVETRYEGEKKLWKYKVLRKAKVNISAEAVVKEKAEELATLGVIEPSPKAEFNPGASITRGELIAWLAKASGIKLPALDRNPFSDVSRDNVLASFIKLVVDRGLLSAFPDGTFRPDEPVTKEEGNRLFGLFGGTAVPTPSTEPPISQYIPQEEKKVASIATEEELLVKGVISLTSTQNFKVEVNLTRRELVVWLSKNYKGTLPALKSDPAVDVKQGAGLAPYVNMALNEGMMNLFPDGTFRLDAPATKQEQEMVFAITKREKR